MMTTYSEEEGDQGTTNDGTVFASFTAPASSKTKTKKTCFQKPSAMSEGAH